jgi:pimeloyl-ACP methyl ester carboxylesterase
MRRIAVRTIAAACGVLLAGSVPAQALKIERYAFARLHALRGELATALRDGGADLQRRVAALAAEPSSGNPFEDLARALAAARGVEADEAFRLRAGLLTLALPGVVDPDLVGEVHVTMHAPRIVPDLGPCRFDLRIRSAAGEVVREARIEEDTGRDDLLRFRATRALPVGDLADGRYEVEVAVILADGAGPRPTDVDHRAQFWVQRGYKARADALPLLVDGNPERVEHARAVAASLAPSRSDPDSRAILTGAVWEVGATYAAEPRPSGSDPIVDLERAEAVLANLRAGRPALDGLAGRMTVGFPLGDGEVGTLSLEVPGSAGHGPLPLVLIVAGAPAWDRDAARPLSPKSLGPGFLEDALAGCPDLVAGPFLLALLESPGRFPSATRAVADALAFLRRTLPVREDAVFLVGEREGGYAVARTAMAAPAAVRGLALVAGGGLSRAELEAPERPAVLAVPAAGHPSTAVLDALGGAGVDGVTPLPAARTPWSVALVLRGPEIAAFVRREAGLLSEREEAEQAGDAERGFVLGRFGPGERTRALALAQWLRSQGIERACVLADGDGRLVVCPTRADREGEDRAALAALPAPAFDPDLLAGIRDAAPEPLPAR